MAAFNTLVLSQRAPGVAQITMARPAVFNAFDEVMIGELDAAFARLVDDHGVRVIVFAGEGKHVSAGADLLWMQRASTASREWNLQDARRFAAMLARIEAAPKPKDTVDATVASLLAGGPGAQREIKQPFAQIEVGPITPEVIELSAQTISRVRGTDEAREGFAAFLGKRATSWIPE